MPAPSVLPPNSFATTDGSSRMVPGSIENSIGGLPQTGANVLVSGNGSLNSLPGGSESQVQRNDSAVDLSQQLLRATSNPQYALNSASAQNAQTAQTPQNALNGHTMQSFPTTSNMDAQAMQNLQNIMAGRQNLQTNTPVLGQPWSPISTGTPPTTPSTAGYADLPMQRPVWGSAMPSPGSISTGSTLYRQPSLVGSRLSLFDPDTPDPAGYKLNPQVLITKEDRDEALTKQREGEEKARQAYIEAKKKQEEQQKQSGNPNKSPGSANTSTSSLAGKSSGSNDSSAKSSTGSSPSSESSEASSTSSGSSTTGSRRRPGPIRRLFQRIFFGRPRRGKPAASQDGSAGGPTSQERKKRIGRIRRFLKWLVGDVFVVKAKDY